MFEIHVQLTKETYGKISAALLVRKFLYFYLLGIFLAIVLAANYILIPEASARWQDFILPTLFVLIFFGMPLLQWRFGYGWKDYPAIAQPVTYRFSEEGLTANGETYHSFQAWTNFIGIRQLKSAVILFFTRNGVFIFPNESFSGVQERENILAFVGQHIPTDRQRLLKLPTVRRFAMTLGFFFAIIIGAYLFLTLFRK